MRYLVAGGLAVNAHGYLRFTKGADLISVGYRVKSKRGTQFRIWATQTLKEHLTRGYTLNRQRFEQNARELETALQLVHKAVAGEALTTDRGSSEPLCSFCRARRLTSVTGLN